MKTFAWHKLQIRTSWCSTSKQLLAVPAPIWITLLIIFEIIVSFKIFHRGKIAWWDTNAGLFESFGVLYYLVVSTCMSNSFCNVYVCAIIILLDRTTEMVIDLPTLNGYLLAISNEICKKWLVLPMCRRGDELILLE